MAKKRSTGRDRIDLDLSRVEGEQKDKAFCLRLSERELDEFRQAADALHTTVAGYLLSLHRQAFEQLREKGKV